MKIKAFLTAVIIATGLSYGHAAASALTVENPAPMLQFSPAAFSLTPDVASPLVRSDFDRLIYGETNPYFLLSSILRDDAEKPAVRPVHLESLFGAPAIRFGAIRSGDRLAKWIGDQKQKSHSGGLDDAALGAIAATINSAVNRRIEYRTDMQLHGTKDVWSLPAETLARGAGDCEDFAILKMGLLADAGVPLKQMSVTIVRDTRRNLYHAVLILDTGAKKLVLDNVTEDIRPDTSIDDYMPLFALNADGNVIFARPAAATASTQVAQVANFSEIAPGAE